MHQKFIAEQKKRKTHQNWPQFRRHLEQRHWHWPKRQTWAATFNMVNDRLWMYSIDTHQYIDRRRGDYLRLNIAEVQARVYLDNYCGLNQNQYTYSTSYRTQYRGVVMAQTLGMFHIVPIINLGINSFFWKTVCYVPNRLLLGLWRIRLISFNLDLWSRICSWFSSLPVNEWDDAGIRNLVEWRNIHPIPLPLPPWVFSSKFPELARYQRGEQSPQRIDAPAIVSGSFRMVQWYCSFPPRRCNRCRLGCNSIMHCMDTFCKDQTDKAAVPRCLRSCHIVPNDIPGFGSRRYLHSHATHRILQLEGFSLGRFKAGMWHGCSRIWEINNLIKVWGNFGE